MLNPASMVAGIFFYYPEYPILQKKVIKEQNVKYLQKILGVI